MEVKIDISEVAALTRASDASLPRQRERFKKILDGQADDARARHRYQNHTYHLQDSTFASELHGDASEFDVEFGARVFYSSFVERRGFQDIERHRDAAESEIEYMFEGEADGLGRL